MKKMLALALIAILYIAFSAWVPTKSVPIDKDVGVCYVLPMDQSQVNMNYIADNTSLPAPDYRVSVFSGVEKPDNNDVLLNSIPVYAPAPVESILIQSTSANNNLQPDGTQICLCLEEGTRFGRAEVVPWTGESV